jgi:hypothetical protein
MRRIAALACASATALLFAWTARAEAPVPAADAPPAVSAVWVERDLMFTYMGFTSYYSCDGLRDKVRVVLERLGARPGFKVTTRSCMNATGPEWSPTLRIVAEFPAEATPELMAELAASAPERELAARAGGRPATEATAQFPARWKRVEFQSGPHGLRDIEDGDCELMEQLRRSVFDQLGVRVLESSVNCVPRQVTLGAVRMAVEVLEPVPPAADPDQ